MSSTPSDALNIVAAALASGPDAAVAGHLVAALRAALARIPASSTGAATAAAPSAINLTADRPKPPAPDVVDDLQGLKDQFAAAQREAMAHVSAGNHRLAEASGARASSLLDRVRRLERAAATA